MRWVARPGGLGFGSPAAGIGLDVHATDATALTADATHAPAGRSGARTSLQRKAIWSSPIRSDLHPNWTRRKQADEGSSRLFCCMSLSTLLGRWSTMVLRMTPRVQRTRLGPYRGRILEVHNRGSYLSCDCLGDERLQPACLELLLAEGPGKKPRPSSLRCKSMIKAAPLSLVSVKITIRSL